MNDDESESSLDASVSAKADRQQARHPDKELGGSKLGSCFLEVLRLTQFSWPTYRLQPAVAGVRVYMPLPAVACVGVPQEQCEEAKVA